MPKIYLATLVGHEKLRYEYLCPSCMNTLTLLTGYGRYGNLGAFDCPICGAKYYATIDDNPDVKVYIHRFGEQPAGFMSGHGKPLAVLLKKECY